MTADVSTTNVFFRNDTLFGTCQAIGEDFGFNPNWIRVPLASSVVLNPFIAVGVYLALSLLVLVSRTIFRSKPAQVAATATTLAEVPVEANDDQRELIAA